MQTNYKHIYIKITTIKYLNKMLSKYPNLIITFAQPDPYFPPAYGLNYSMDNTINNDEILLDNYHTLSQIKKYLKQTYDKKSHSLNLSNQNRTKYFNLLNGTYCDTKPNTK